MTDQDNLRDKIADGVLRMHRIIGTTGRTGRVVCCSCDLTWRDHAQYQRHLAQAIIDEFGLTVETRVVHKKTLDRDVLERLRRVIGTWREESEWSNPSRSAGNAGTWTPGTSEENANDPTDAEDHATSSTP